VPSGPEGYDHQHRIISRSSCSIVSNRGTGCLQPARLSRWRKQEQFKLLTEGNEISKYILDSFREKFIAPSKSEAVFGTKKKLNSKLSQKAAELTPSSYRPAVVGAGLKRGS
jgi:hypothetical protein